ncbi:sensor histidine kinase [Planobispora rosea]|uniref:histidine kinase n=1 Tax=Planobispora rosea TaxID=35762 RepID=A0A8J3S2H1_PLARO|nr:ATP-binding protein [Planobispora rosea]GGS93335.1 sensor histidine kinase [Planobispora rosea]GIH87251.1 sensor histidine kinase [Planobispora rosea]
MADAEDAQRLRSLLTSIELFAGVTEEQYEWLATAARRRRLADGEVLFRDGDPATEFYVLLDGELVVTKVEDGREEILTRHTTRSKPDGGQDGKPTAAHGFTGELPLLTDGGYVATVTAVGETTVLVYPKPVFFEMLVRCPSVARVLLPVLAWRIKASELQARNRATVMALGTLAAGLAHELNNPAAAVARAAQELRPAVARLTDTASAWGRIATDEERDALARTADDALDTPAPTETDPVTLADIEDEIADWADEQGAARAARLASALADLGLSQEWLARRTAGLHSGAVPVALDHLAALLEVRGLVNELQIAAPRISALIAATRDYANLDRAPEQRFSVTDGLEATLTVLRSKLSEVRVVREYDAEIPEILGYPTELNQVWTNLIDNAVDAMDGRGTLTLRTSLEGNCLTVEIGDSGSGIPADSLSRIFEPFYTTKDVGKGTGLGLHLSYRIVTQRHNGSITVRSVPGDTRMLVRIPVEGSRGTLCAS